MKVKLNLAAKIIIVGTVLFALYVANQLYGLVAVFQRMG